MNHDIFGLKQSFREKRQIKINMISLPNIKKEVDWVLEICMQAPTGDGRRLSTKLMSLSQSHSTTQLIFEKIQ